MNFSEDNLNKSLYKIGNFVKENWRPAIIGLASMMIPPIFRLSTGNSILPYPFDSDTTEKLFFTSIWYAVGSKILGENVFGKFDEHNKYFLRIFGGMGHYLLWTFGIRYTVSKFFNPMMNWGFRLFETPDKVVEFLGHNVNAYGLDGVIAITTAQAALLIPDTINYFRTRRNSI